MLPGAVQRASLTRLPPAIAAAAAAVKACKHGSALNQPHASTLPIQSPAAALVLLLENAEAVLGTSPP